MQAIARSARSRPARSMALGSRRSLATAERMIRRAVLPGILLASLLGAAACERAKAPASGMPISSSSPPPSPEGVRAVATPKPWDDELGAMLATQSLDGGAPVLFVRDTASNADLDVELLNHDDHTSR